MARQNAAGTARHPREHARHCARRCRQGSDAGEPGACRPVGRGAAAFEQLSTFFRKNGGYGSMMMTRPRRRLRPVGFARRPCRLDVRQVRTVDLQRRRAGAVLTKDEMLDDITLYWLTNSAISSAQLYWENNANNFNAVEDISIPAAVTVFPGEIYRAPRSWVESAATTI